MNNIIIIIFVILIIGVIYKNSYSEIYNDIYTSGSDAETDKIYMHGYHRFYDTVLNKYRNMQNIGMMEIGVQGYNSIKMWLSYFKYAHIYGIDIDQKQSEDERVDLYKCDQSNLLDLQNIRSILDPKYPIMFIIDDGSHIPEHQMLSFDYFFSEVLQDGGVYIIEDTEVSYWKAGTLYGYNANYGWKDNKSLIEKFKWIADIINIKYINDNEKNELNSYTTFLSDKTKNAISSITFAQNCIIIYKKQLDDYDPKHMYNDKNYVHKNYT